MPSCRSSGSRCATGGASWRPDLAVEPDQNVHRRGTDTRQGNLLLAAGTRLGPPEIAIAAGAGMARIRVSSQPMLAVISTGNELIEPGEPILPHQVRRSNAYAIAAALRLHGFQRVADDHIVDDSAELRRRLKFHLETHDVLVLSGGVSMGKLDLVPRVLEELGVRCVFHKVAQRPGQAPLVRHRELGRRGPGPARKPRLHGGLRLPLRASRTGRQPGPDDRPGRSGWRSARRSPSSPRSRYFLPIRIEIDDWGRSWAMPAPTNGSGDFTALAGTDGFVELPPGPNTYPKGFVTRLHRW